MPSAPLRNFHLPLTGETYDRLKEEAARERRPATIVAREAIEEWLRERRRQFVREEIAAYAAIVAGSEADLDAGLERAAVEHLLENSKKR
jgi:predicted transcriptional regulator